jgi:curved DNA-binding protein CbpA
MNELHKAYAVLGLDPGSSMESIMRRYKRLIMVWHPDRAPSPEHKEFAEEELKKINNAKDVLTKHFGANGGHRATGCDCQAGAGTTAGAGARSSSSSSAGPGPNYHRSKTADEKYQEEQAAKKKDAERKAREQAEANARRQQEQYTQQTTQQTMEAAMQQQAALRDEKLRWQISIGLIIAFVALEIFGTMAIGAKNWWKDMSWKWQNQQSSSKPPDTNTDTGTNTGTSTGTYIPPYYQTPGGNQESWEREQAQRDKEQKEHDQKQHDQDVYSTRLEIDKYEKIIEHCNSELTKLEIQIADPGISEYEKNKLREMRDFRQKNLAEGRAGLKAAQEKLARLSGETPTQIAPSLVSPITGSNTGVPLVPSNSSPFAPPADPNSTLLNPSTTPSIFKRKYGLDGLSTPSTSTPSLSEMMKKYADPSTTTPSTKSFFDKKYGGLDSLTTPSSSTSSLSELMKKYKTREQTTSSPSTTNP